MSILFDLSLWQEFLLVGLAIVSLLYVFYFKIWVTLAAGSDLVFAAALVVAVSSVAMPPIFDGASASLVDRSALPEALQSADDKVAAIEALPSELIERALTKLGYEPETDDESLPTPGPGPFTSQIRPSVEKLVAVVLRATSFLTASLLLLMALALRSSTSTARALQNIALRTEVLEARLAESSPPNLRDNVGS